MGSCILYRKSDRLEVESVLFFIVIRKCYEITWPEGVEFLTSLGLIAVTLDSRLSRSTRLRRTKSIEFLARLKYLNAFQTEMPLCWTKNCKWSRPWCRAESIHQKCDIMLKSSCTFPKAASLNVRSFGSNTIGNSPYKWGICK